MNAMLNVSTNTCDQNCMTVFPHPPSGEHWGFCAAASSIPIHCPITRSVTFTVRRGECVCTTRPGPMLLPRTVGFIEEAHEAGCPARPISVSCSISGETWEESEVAEWDAPIGYEDVALMHQIRDACRDRWALVKALVLGHTDLSTHLVGPKAVELLHHRDKVYAAIVKVARLERAIFEAQGEYTSAMDEHHYPDWHRDTESYEMPSQKMLALYVERLIEQVGGL